jgi:hypothetical protein
MEVQSVNAMEELSDNIAEEEFQIYESPEDESQQGAQAENDSLLEEDSQEDIQGRQVAEALLMDTNDLGSLRSFQSQIINLKHGPEAGNQLLLLIKTILKTLTEKTSRLSSVAKDETMFKLLSDEQRQQVVDKWFAAATTD